jgi:hypothetical protein
MSNVQLADKIIKELYDNITESKNLYTFCFEDAGMSKFYYRRRMVREQIKKYFKTLSVKEVIMNSVIIVYFIYNNKYCRLAITENNSHAKFLSNVKYEK